MRAETNWLHIAAIQGEQNLDRILFLCERHTGHDFKVTIYFDYSTSSSSVKTFSAATIASLGRQWLDREVTQATHQAVKVVVEDVTPSSGSVGTGQGSTWVAMSFNGEPHQGARRTTATQRGGS